MPLASNHLHDGPWAIMLVVQLALVAMSLLSKRTTTHTCIPFNACDRAGPKCASTWHDIEPQCLDVSNALNTTALPDSIWNKLHRH